MSVHASFLDQLKQLIDRIFHRDCGLSESDCQRLKSMNEHFKNVPAKQAIVSGNLSLHHRPGTNVKLVAYTKSGGDTIPLRCRWKEFAITVHRMDTPFMPITTGIAKALLLPFTMPSWRLSIAMD